MSKGATQLGLVLALVLVIGVLGFAKQDRFVGEGTQIIVGSSVGNEIYADESCWVRHGWVGTYIPGRQPAIKDQSGVRSFVGAGLMTFQLYIDNSPVKLRSKRDVFPNEEPGTSRRYWTWYVQFEPYHFDPGVYALRGVYDAKNPNNYTANILGLPLTVTSTLTVLTTP